MRSNWLVLSLHHSSKLIVVQHPPHWQSRVEFVCAHMYPPSLLFSWDVDSEKGFFRMIRRANVLDVRKSPIGLNLCLFRRPYLELCCTYHSEELASPTLKHGIGPQTTHFSVPPCHSTNLMGRPESRLF